MKKSTRTLFFIFSTTILLLMSGCAPASTAEASVPPQEGNANNLQTVADAEKLSGFDVKEPSYLPMGVSLDTVSYQSAPNPYVILQFKIIHETYGDMGNFFQIMQEAQQETPADVLSCGENAEGCEVLQINNASVVYHQNPGGTEGLDWYTDGFVFRLLRTAGEPNKVYKDELIKVVESMQ